MCSYYKRNLVYITECLTVYVNVVYASICSVYSICVCKDSVTGICTSLVSLTTLKFCSWRCQFQRSFYGRCSSVDRFCVFEKFINGRKRKGYYRYTFRSKSNPLLKILISFSV